MRSQANPRGRPSEKLSAEVVVEDRGLKDRIELIADVTCIQSRLIKDFDVLAF